MLAETQFLSDFGVGGVVVAHRGGDFRQVVHPFCRDDALALTHGVDRFGWPQSPRVRRPSATTGQRHRQRTGWRWWRRWEVPHRRHRTCCGCGAPACEWLAGVFAAPLFVLVEHDHVGDVEHFDLLELGVCAELGGHDIEGTVGHRRDGVAALADAAGLTKDEVEADRFGDLDGSVEVGADLRAKATAGKAAHVEVVVGERVHANAVAKKGATGSLSGWVNA